MLQKNTRAEFCLFKKSDVKPELYQFPGKALTFTITATGDPDRRPGIPQQWY